MLVFGLFVRVNVESVDEWVPAELASGGLRCVSGGFDDCGDGLGFLAGMPINEIGNGAGV